MVGGGTVRCDVGRDDSTGLRDGQVVKPDVHVRQLGLPLGARDDQLRVVHGLESCVGAHRRPALHEASDDSLERRELLAGWVRVLKARPLMGDEQHFHVHVLGHHRHLAGLDEILMWRPAVQLEKVGHLDDVHRVAMVYALLTEEFDSPQRAAHHGCEGGNCTPK